jgi:hypothetical protein
MINYITTVKKVLETSARSRDNDVILYSYVLNKLSVNPTIITAEELIMKMYENEIPTYDSISRLRRKVQAENPELRGTVYHLRKKRAKEVQEELGYKV